MSVEDEELLANVIGEIQDSRNRGEEPDRDTYLARYPQFGEELASFFECETFFEQALAPTGLPPVERARPEEISRIDLKAFPIKKRLDDIGLGTVYLLAATEGTGQRELIVQRAWFTPPERARIEKSMRFCAKRDIPGLLPVLELGHLNQVPFVLREHESGPELATLIRHLIAHDGNLDFAGASRRRRAEGDRALPAERPPPAVLEPLAARLARSRSHLDQVLRAFSQWARILHRAHSTGLVHREITPRTLMLSPEGEARVQGIGLVWSGTRIHPSRMREWDPQWLAPEVCDSSWGPVTWKADVYGLGMVLCAVLSLAEPYPGLDGEATVQSIAGGGCAFAARLPEELPDDLRDLVREATENELTQRLVSLEAFADRLDELCGVTPSRAAGLFARRARR